MSPTPPTPDIIEVNDTVLYLHHEHGLYFLSMVCAGTTLINGATDTLLDISTSGNYNVLVTYANGCEIAVGINVILGMQNYAIGKIVSLFPNPVNNYLSIHTSSLHSNEVMTISIINALGEIIQEEKVKWSK